MKQSFVAMAAIPSGAIYFPKFIQTHHSSQWSFPYMKQQLGLEPGEPSHPSGGRVSAEGLPPEARPAPLLYLSVPQFPDLYLIAFL